MGNCSFIFDVEGTGTSAIKSAVQGPGAEILGTFALANMPLLSEDFRVALLIHWSLFNEWLCLGRFMDLFSRFPYRWFTCGIGV